MAPTIIPRDDLDAQRLALALLAAVGPERHHEIRTVTDGPRVAFDVPDDLAAAVTGVPVGEAQLPDAPPPGAAPEPPVGAAEDEREETPVPPVPPLEPEPAPEPEPAATIPVPAAPRPRGRPRKNSAS